MSGFSEIDVVTRIIIKKPSDIGVNDIIYKLSKIRGVYHIEQAE